MVLTKNNKIKKNNKKKITKTPFMSVKEFVLRQMSGIRWLIQHKYWLRTFQDIPMIPVLSALWISMIGVNHKWCRGITVIKELSVFLNEWWINLLESTWMYISKTGVLGLTGSGGTPGVYPIYGTYLSEMWGRPMHVRGIKLTWMIWHADLLIWVCMRGSMQMWEKAERG